MGPVRDIAVRRGRGEPRRYGKDQRQNLRTDADPQKNQTIRDFAELSSGLNWRACHHCARMRSFVFMTAKRFEISARSSRRPKAHSPLGKCHMEKCGGSFGIYSSLVPSRDRYLTGLLTLFWITIALG